MSLAVHGGDSSGGGGGSVTQGTDPWNVKIDQTGANNDVDIAGVTPVSGRVPVDGSGVTQPVSGTFFQATQPVSITLERATTGDAVGVIVSTAAVSIIASNAARKNITITNNNTAGNIFLSKAGTVTASGAAMGVKLLPGGSYNDSGEDCYTGALFAIGDTVSVVHNVSVWERT